MSHVIGILNEKPLHAALKQAYALPGDRTEVPLDGFVIDVVRGDLLVEIQTRNLWAIRRKLARLAQSHPVRLVYPIAQEKWIVRMGQDGERVLGRRKSPARGSVELVFSELVSMPHLLCHPNFSLEVVLTREEEVRRPDVAAGWRRRGWVTQERRLLDIMAQHLFETPSALGGLLPTGLVEPFTVRTLAEALGRPPRLAGKMAYCLREAGVILPAGRQGRAAAYVRSDA